MQCWARDPKRTGQRHTRYARPIMDKESAKWLHSFEALCTLQQRCRDTTLISVGDREADIYELFVRAQRPGSAQLLIRAERTRRMVKDHGPLWDFIATQPLAGTQVIDVPRRTARPPRRARMHIRFAEVELQAPKRKHALGPLRLWAVWTHEPHPPKGTKALDWMVLTTLPVLAFQQRSATLGLVPRALREHRQVYHRTLKGPSVASSELPTPVAPNASEACLALDLVAPWRIFHLAKLGRDPRPTVPCSSTTLSAKRSCPRPQRRACALNPCPPSSLSRPLSHWATASHLANSSAESARCDTLGS